MSVTGHNHDASGAPTYPDYRDRCPVGCDDLTPVRMADTNVQLVGKDRLVTRRLVLDGPSQFAKITPPRTPTTLDAAWEALEIDLDDDHRVMSVIARHRPLIEAEARAAPDPAPLDVERLLPFLRHTNYCVLRNVRDNAPWDEACDCGLAALVHEPEPKSRVAE